MEVSSANAVPDPSANAVPDHRSNQPHMLVLDRDFGMTTPRLKQLSWNDRILHVVFDNLSQHLNHFRFPDQLIKHDGRNESGTYESTARETVNNNFLISFLLH
jgi:hypothetical protein